MDIERHHPELLAPVGRRDVLPAVIAAGADAVYLGAKQFNMRMHRRDFHFDDEGLAWAVDYAHQRRVKVYVTVNSLIADRELDAAGRLLEKLQALAADAIIVQDLGVLKLASEMGLTVPRHASTQMNVHDAATARRLKRYGVTRVIASRDISLEHVARIRREAGIEVEYFVHGDMCVCHGGQCYMSALTLYKSSNRGECMKPCRWRYRLVELCSGRPLRSEAEGYLLAVKDLSLLRHLPELVQAGVDSLKIEGRMRDADYLGRLVALYREAIDAYYRSPLDWHVPSRLLEVQFRHRVRDLSTMLALGPSRADLIATDGRREPLFLSDGRREPRLTAESADATSAPAGRPLPELAVTVATPEAVREALAAGADRVDLAWERPQEREPTGGIEAMRRAIDRVREAGARVGLKTPRVLGPRQAAELRWVLARLAAAPPDGFLVHTLGALDVVREHGQPVIGDFGLNVLNGRSAAALAELGAGRVTASIEASFDDLRSLCAASPLPVELIAYGPLEGMLIEHCVYALHVSESRSRDVCRAPCQHLRVGLQDVQGEVRRVWADQYCRNHLLTGSDLCLLGHLGRVLASGVAALRIEGQHYSAEALGLIVRLHRDKLQAWAAGDAAGQALTADDWAILRRVSPHGVGLLALGGQVTRSRSTLETMQVNGRPRLAEVCS